MKSQKRCFCSRSLSQKNKRMKKKLLLHSVRLLIDDDDNVILHSTVLR